MTAEEKTCLIRYNNSIKQHGYRHIKYCYNYPSKIKLAIWHDIAMQCHELHGTGLTVVTYNSHVFTVAFKYKKDGKVHLVYFASSYTLDFEVPEHVEFD